MLFKVASGLLGGFWLALGGDLIKIDFQPCLATKPTLNKKNIYIKKIVLWIWPLSFICRLGNLCGFIGCNVIPVTMQKYFERIFISVECVHDKHPHPWPQRCKICQKYSCVVTGITLQPIKSHRLP